MSSSQTSLSMDEPIPTQESETEEFKRSWQEKECLQSLAAFANTRGGNLWVGLDDNGSVPGWQGDGKTMEIISNQITSKLQIHPLALEVRLVARMQILVIRMAPAASPVAVNGRYYRRVGNSSREVPAEELPRFILEKTGQSWDDLPSEATSRDVFDPAVATFRRLGAERLSPELQEEPVPFLLDKLNLLHPSGCLKRGAVLLFTREPDRWFRHARVQVARVEADEISLSDERRITGSLTTQLEETLGWLRKQLKVSYEFPGGGTGVSALQRQEVWEIPLVALREALLNAFLHRDYTALSAIQVRVYRDKVCIDNPGGLSERLTIADLSRRHNSLPRNPLLADIAYKMNLVESWGTGTLRMAQACAKAGLPTPDFASEASGFSVTLWRDKYSTESLRTQGVSERQIAAIRTVQEAGGITNRVYRDQFGLSDEATRQELNNLTERNLLRRVGAGRSVRYTL